MLPEEVTISEIQSNYVRAFQEVFETQEEWFGDNAGLWRVKLPKHEDGRVAFGPIFKSAIERESHVHDVVALYRQGLLTQSSLARRLGCHVFSAWVYLTSDPGVGVRFSTSGLAETADECALLAEGDIRLVVDISALLTIRCLELESEITRAFKEPIIAQAVLDEISAAIHREEMFAAPREYVSISSQHGKIVGHNVSDEVAKHNVAAIKDFESWVRNFCRVAPVPQVLSDYGEDLQNLDFLVGEMEACTILLAKSQGNILYSDDLLVRQLTRSELRSPSVSTESVLAHLRRVKAIEESEHTSKVLRLFKLNYREIRISPGLVLAAASESQWGLAGAFEAVCSAIRGGNQERSSLIPILAECLLEIDSSPASETAKLQLSCRLLNCATTRFNAAHTASAIINTIQSRSLLYLVGDERVINLVKLWISTRSTDL
jgi:hypothetical protein